MINFAVLLRAFDAALVLGDAVRRLKKGDAPPPDDAPDTRLAARDSEPVAAQIEARLTNVVLAALKEAFARDHERLELERAQIEAQARRAEQALRLERRRQAVDGELARVRLMAGAALVGWAATVLLLVGRLDGASIESRAVIGIGWLLLIGACGSAFAAQRRIAASLLDDGATPTGWSTAALALLVGGLALTTASLLF